MDYSPDKIAIAGSMTVRLDRIHLRDAAEHMESIGRDPFDSMRMAAYRFIECMERKGYHVEVVPEKLGKYIVPGAFLIRPEPGDRSEYLEPLKEVGLEKPTDGKIKSEVF